MNLKPYVKFWPLIVGAFAVISGWLGMSFMLKLHDQDIKEIKSEIKDLPIIRNDLKRATERAERYSRERRPN